MLLTMSDVERGIYDNCKSTMEQRQMCCHLQVVERLQKVIGSDMMTLNQVKDVMIAHTNQVCSLCHVLTLWNFFIHFVCLIFPVTYWTLLVLAVVG